MNERQLAKKLLTAIYANDLWMVKQCIQAGANPNWICNGFPFLLHAVEHADVMMVSLLLDLGATQKDQALWFALRFFNLPCAWFLLQQGALPRYYASNMGYRPKMRIEKMMRA
ncbi:MAG: hypothetical protein ACRCZJ_07025 [Erysipelotrichaceae bacterium]